jgi:regulator of nucleoside diphosphate kinase
MPKSVRLVNRRDVERLRSLVPKPDTPAARGAAHLARLATSVYDGAPVAPEEVPPDVVTMNSIVRIRNLDSGETSTYGLVFPSDADMKVRSISVLAPIGAALFGRTVGERFEVVVPSGQTRHFEVVEITYQPEAAGELDL